MKKIKTIENAALKAGGFSLKPGYWNDTIKLNEKQLLPEKAQCPFCASIKRKRIYQIQDNPDVHLMQCLDCHAVSVSRMPDNTTLKHYYGSYYTGEVHEQATVEMKMGLPRRFALNILKEYSPEAGRDTVNIMDFGGGDGILAKEIASLLLKKGLKKALITVVDMSKTKCISEDKRVKIVSYETIEKIKKEKFDIVIASAVLEHIPNPLNEFSMLLEALKPSGFFYARTPYIVPVMKLCALFNIHVDFGYPGHLHDLGQRFWENSLNVIGKETRYKITASKPSVVGSVFAVHPVQTILAYILKFPWYILRKNYGIVGGWEIFIIRE